MKCPERTRRIDHYERTARAYAEAVSGLRDLQGYDLIAQERLVVHIREACDAAATSLAEHHQSHGCARVGTQQSLENKVA